MALATIKNAVGQSFRIPEPPLTEKNLPSQAGRVHIVTGGYAGCGFELSRILYGADAVVYVAGRSQEKADKAIAAIKQAVPDSKGRVEFMKVDLADLTTIKPAVDAFTAKENRLDGKPTTVSTRFLANDRSPHQQRRCHGPSLGQPHSPEPRTPSRHKLSRSLPPQHPPRTHPQTHSLHLYSRLRPRDMGRQSCRGSRLP